MQLMMYLGNDLIEAVPLHFDRISQPGYLGQFKRVLKDKYADLLRESGQSPEFLITELQTEQKRSYQQR